MADCQATTVLTEEALQEHESLFNVVREEDSKERPTKRISRPKTPVGGRADAKAGPMPTQLAGGKETTDTPTSSVVRRQQREEYRMRQEERRTEATDKSYQEASKTLAQIK